MGRAQPAAVVAVFDTAPATADDEAGYLGAAFVEPDDDDEWMAWLNWDEVDAGGAGPSSA